MAWKRGSIPETLSIYTASSRLVQRSLLTPPSEISSADSEGLHLWSKRRRFRTLSFYRMRTRHYLPVPVIVRFAFFNGLRQQSYPAY